MNRAMNAIMICAVDDVATTIVELPAGDVGRYSVNGQCCEIAIKEIVPKYHKFAVRDIPQGGFVHKYGEIIGVTTQNISKGCHVHEHNLSSMETEKTQA